MNEKELTYWMALAHTGKITTSRKNQILVACFERQKSLGDFFMSDEHAWKNDYALDLMEEEESLLLEAKGKLPNYSFQAEDLLEQGYCLIPITAQEYPKSLKKHLKYKAPILLYTKGNKALLQKECTAIVGSRNAQQVSLDFTDEIANKIVKKDQVVVSGYAKGVDRQALDSALKYGGSSIVVLPQGITTFTSGYRSLYKEIRDGRILVMSTFVPKAPWSKGLAMARNSTVYALANSIYVAESDSHGGTWEGVNAGLKIKGYTIYVRIPNTNEKNANMQLIQKGAIAVDSHGNPVDFHGNPNTKPPIEPSLPFQ